MQIGVEKQGELNALRKMEVILRVDLNCKMQIQMQMQI